MITVFDNILLWHGDKENDYLSILDKKASLTVSNEAIPSERMVSMEQIAQDIITIVTETDAGAGFINNKEKIARADAIITNAKNVFLCVRTADCFPILIFDHVQKVIAAVHSGREGTKRNIVGKTIQKMQEAFQCSADHLHVSIGAGISKEYYAVDKDCYFDYYNSQSSLYDSALLAEKLNSKTFNIDLCETILLQLYAQKINKEHINIIDKCTYQDNNYFSYRRNKTKNRQLSTIGIKL